MLFRECFPRLYHVSQAPDLATIYRYGLLSTTAILDLLGISGCQRELHERGRRIKSVPLTGSVEGMFVLNDQSPLNLEGLSKCLVGMSQEAWLRELNRRVFFFPEIRESELLADAIRSRERRKLVLEYETADLLKLGEAACSIASINTGYTMRRPAARGCDTFMPLSTYTQRPRPRVKEFCVLYSVPASIPFRVVSQVA